MMESNGLNIWFLFPLVVYGLGFVHDWRFHTRIQRCFGWWSHRFTIAILAVPQLVTTPYHIAIVLNRGLYIPLSPQKDVLYILVYIYIQIYKHTNKQTNIHTYMYTCIHIYIHVYIYTHMYICIWCITIIYNTYMCIYIYTHMYMYTHPQIHGVILAWHVQVTDQNSAAVTWWSELSPTSKPSARWTSGRKPGRGWGKDVVTMIEGSFEVNRPTSLGEMEKAEVGIYD